MASSSHLRNPASSIFQLPFLYVTEKEIELFQVTYIKYTDDNSFQYEGVHKAGYAMASDTIVLEAQAFPVQTTNQQTELNTLTHACQLGK